MSLAIPVTTDNRKWLETGSTYIFENMRDAIEIPTAYLGFMTIECPKNAWASDATAADNRK